MGDLAVGGLACSLCQQQRDIEARLAPDVRHVQGVEPALGAGVGGVAAVALDACPQVVCSLAACAAVALACLLGEASPLPDQQQQHPAALHHAHAAHRGLPSYAATPQAGAQAHVALSWACWAVLVACRQVHCPDMHQPALHP